MPTVHRTPVIDVSLDAPDHLTADLLIVPLFEADDLADLRGVDRAVGGALSQAMASGEASGKPFELFLAPSTQPGAALKRVAAVGAGPRAQFTTERARRVATTGAIAARQRKMAHAAVLVRGGDAAVVAQAMADGLVVANFESGSFKTTVPAPTFLDRGTIVAPGAGDALKAAVTRGRLLGESANIVRDLTNAPGNGLTPVQFAARAVELGREAGLQVEVLDEHRLEALHAGLLLGVARGSAEPPRMIVLRHEPAAAPPSPVLALVGKGITFDTGGISIKPAERMELMKDDMAGGAAVIAAMRAIALLQLPVRVVGVVPASENMPGGRAVKPGDVLTSASGKTVEIINTDAEGRLVLGDGLWYAQQLGATHLVDVATLTGACVVALGRTTSGLFGTPDAWVSQVLAASERGGDRLWPMPVFDDYKEQLKSEIADLSNSGGRPAGSITAALFLKEFAGTLPWCHIDIAGTAWADDAKPYMPKGPTGAAVRTLVELASSLGAVSKDRSGV